MTGGQRREREPVRAQPDSGDAQAVEADGAAAATVEALLLAQHGYLAAADAADGASVPSLTDFVD